MELVGIGDLHLDKMDSLIPGAIELQCLAVERVLRYALKNGIKHVVFYGDICERPRLSYAAQKALYKLLLKDEYSELQFHFILGNHDFAEDGTHSLEVFEAIASSIGLNFHVYTDVTRTTLDGVAFNFLPYPHTTTTNNAINVGHFEVAGSLRDNGRKIDEGASTKHFTLMGHLHTRHRVRRTHYSGTLYQTNFGEVEEKFFHHVIAKSHKPEDIEVKCVPFKPPWRLVNLTLSSEEDLKGLDTDPSTLYKVYLKDGSSLDIDKVLQDHPNIVKHNTFKTRKELEQLVQQSWDFSDAEVDDIVNVEDDATSKELLKQLGWGSTKIDKALKILTRIKGNRNEQRRS